MSSTEQAAAQDETVEKARKFIARQKDDIGRLTQQYQKLRDEFNRERLDKEQAQQQFDEALQSKNTMEIECQQLYQKWMQELKSQAEEFQSQVSQMVPSRELELLRIQMMEELEQPHQQKVKLLEDEIRNHHAAYLSEHRTLELLRTEVDLSQQDHVKDVQEAKAHLQDQLEEMHQKNRRLEELAYDTSMSDKLRQTERVNASLELQVQHLTIEFKATQTADIESRMALEAAKLQHAKVRQTMDGQLQIKQEDCAGLQNRGDDLASELSAKIDELTRSRERIVTMERDKLSFDDRVAAKDTQIRELEKQMAQRLGDKDRQHGEEKALLNNRIERYQQALDDAESALQAQAEDMACEQRDHQAQVNRMQRDFGQQLEDAQQARSRLELALSESEQAQTARHSAATEEADTLRSELEATRSSLRDVTADRDSLAERVEKLLADKKQLSNDLDAQMREYNELSDEYHDLQAKHRDVLHVHHDKAAEADKFRTQVEFLEKDLNTFTSQIDEEREAQVFALRQTQDKHKRDRQVMQENMEDLESEMSQKDKDLQQHLARLKKEKNRYKKMAAILKSRVTSLGSDISQQKKDLSMQLRTKQYEMDGLVKQVGEAERQRDELRFRLSMDQNIGSIGGDSPASSFALSGDVGVESPAGAFTANPLVATFPGVGASGSLR